MPSIDSLRVKIFADGADKTDILALCTKPWIQGFTTNPTLMWKAGVTDYETFVRDLVAAIPDHPLSFEIFTDNFTEMEYQASKIHAWGDNIRVKIPITNARGESSIPLIHRLAGMGVKQNVTAIMTLDQIAKTVDALADGPEAYVSVFAGRIADTGRDPMPVMREAVRILAPHPGLELIWASSREVLNIFHADSIGCHIITLTHDILAKMELIGKDLDDFSLETVRMFHCDAEKAGYRL